MDRISPSEGEDAGSIPAESTKICVSNFALLRNVPAHVPCRNRKIFYVCEWQVRRTTNKPENHAPQARFPAESTRKSKAFFVLSGLAGDEEDSKLMT